MMLALCTMVRNERPYLLEWLAFHAMAGGEHFRIYDNESDDGTTELLHEVADHFNIDVVPWPETGFDRQVLAFNDGLLMLRHRAAFVAFIDVDEFLFDPQFRPLPEILAGLDPDISAIGVNQRVFGSSNLTEDSGDLVVRRFVYRGVDDYHEHRWYKTIVRPDKAMGFGTSHSVMLREGHYVLGDIHPFQQSAEHPGQADRIAANGLVLNHYVLKSLSEFRRKQQRGAASDRPEASFKRLDEDYFFNRERYVNAFLDCSLAEQAPAVEAHIATIMAQTVASEPVAQPPEGHAFAVNIPIPIDDINPRFGFAPTIAGFAWIRSFAEGRFLLRSDGEAVHIAIRAYRIAASYDIDQILMRLNGEIVRLTATREDDHWFTLQTGLVETREGTNLLALESPYFVPVRFVDPKADDARYLSFGVASLMFLR